MILPYLEEKGQTGLLPCAIDDDQRGEKRILSSQNH
jgi:hypothetical protein